MPENKISDPTPDQEIAFARFVLSGMTDQQAAEAAGLDPATAAYIKSKPHVRAYMLEHRALAEQQLAAQQAESVRQLNIGRERVLARLWEIANLSPEMTRGSVTAQVKALSMIVAIEGLIPGKMTDRRAGSAAQQPAPPPPPVQAKFYTSAWLRNQQQQTTGHGPREEERATPQVDPAEDAPAVSGPDFNLDPGNNVDSLPGTQPTSGVPFAPGPRLPFSIKNGPFGHRN